MDIDFLDLSPILAGGVTNGRITLFATNKGEIFVSRQRAVA